MANKQENPNDAALQPIQQQNAPALVFDTIEHFNNAQRMCQCLATAGMLPAHFRGQENFGNCMIALEIAQRGQLPVMEIFQNLITVQGRISWYATYLIGRVNSCGKYSTLTWESEHENTENWRMRARSVELSTGEVLKGSWVSIRMARAEHWGSKWNTMPEQMLRYRSAAFWVRAFCPNIAMGIKDQYEVEDIVAEEIATGKPAAATVSTDEKRTKAKNALKAAIAKKDNAEEAQVVNENPDNQPDNKPADAPAQPAQPAQAPANGEPQPVVKVVVEPTEGAQPAKPRNPYLDRALKNMGLNNPNGDTQTEIPTDNQ